MKKQKLNKKGFSLVELIIAVAVLAIIVVPLLRTFVISQNMSTKAIDYTQATIAAENILKTVEARPVSDFMNLNATDDNSVSKQELLSQMISANSDITFANGIDDSRILFMNTLQTDDKEFISVLNGVKSGSNTYDAIVTFDRGDGDDPNSDGIKEINDHTIVEYDKMDAVFCQSHIDDSNPDKRADTELKAQAASRFGKDPDEEPDAKSRKIVIHAYQDDEDGNTITCYVDYTYSYTYKDVYEGETHYDSRTGISIETTYSYAIFPGGYAYDGSLIAIYIMYYPWSYSTDEIEVYNNVDRDGMSYDTPLNLSVYLYMQEPDTITDQSTYKQVVDYYMPEGYELASEEEDSEDGFSAETLIYTNAKNIGSFQLYVNQGWGWSDRTAFNAKITGDMVKRKPNKLMYNVTVEIFDAGSVTVDPTSHEITVTGTPVYTATGSKSQN